MSRFLGRFSPVVYALLRIITGLMFACHGAAHLFGWFAPKMQVPVGSFKGVGGVIELITGFLIAFGLLADWAAFLASGTMAVAYFNFHVGGSGSLLPIVNGGDAAVLYCWIFLYIAFHGAGILSLDQLLFGRSTAAGGNAPLVR